MAFMAIPTLAGQAAITAALDPNNTVAITISKMVVGDGNGSETTPLETQTDLVNERAEVPITEFTRADNKMTIDAILDETIGTFTIREAGIVDDNGTLLFVASIPATEKVTGVTSVVDILTLGLVVVVADTAQVSINVDGVTYATHDYVNSVVDALRTNITHPLRPYHIAINSAALSAPPESPTPGDTYLVATDPTDAWAGHAGKLAQYIGSEEWVFATLPDGMVVADAATGLILQKAGSTWTAIIPAKPATTGWLQCTPAGGKSWTDPFDISSLAAHTLVGSDKVPFHSVAAEAKRSTTVDALAEYVAAHVMATDYFSSEIYFHGMM
jgi:phage-related tail fiber protein